MHFDGKIGGKSVFLALVALLRMYKEKKLFMMELLFS